MMSLQAPLLVHLAPRLLRSLGRRRRLRRLTVGNLHIGEKQWRNKLCDQLLISITSYVLRKISLTRE